MEDIKAMNLYQKALLIIMLAMTLIFTVIYPITISKVGFKFNDAIFVPEVEDGSTLYTGKIQGKQACFTVSDHTVIFNCNNKTYGPYTMKVDPTAVPKGTDYSEYMTGIEIYNGDLLYFRGGVMYLGDFYWLSSENGNNMLGLSYEVGDGVERDEYGNPIDRMQPSPSTIYELLDNPKLTHKGDALGWFGGLLMCIINAVSIFFADSLFRWNLGFRIRNAEDAEPSDWEIAGRYIGWTVVTIIALVLYIIGLQ